MTLDKIKEFVMENKGAYILLNLKVQGIKSMSFKVL